MNLNQLIEKFQRLSFAVKLVLLLAVAAFAAWMSWDSSVVPAQSALEAAVADDAQLTQELENLNKSGQSLTAIEATRRKTEEEFRALFELLPRDLDIDKLLAGFADAARDSGSSLKKFTPARPNESAAASSPVPAPAPAAAPGGAPAAPAAPPAPTFGLDSLQRFTITVTLEGTFAQINNFFDRVLSLPRIVRLDTFKFEPIASTGAVTTPTPRPGGTMFGAGATLEPTPSASGKLALKTAPDGSPILKCDAQFTSYTQKGDFQALAALSAPPQVQSAPPPPAAPAAEGTPSEGSSGDATGMSAKPLDGGGQ